MAEKLTFEVIFIVKNAKAKSKHREVALKTISVEG